MQTPPPSPHPTLDQFKAQLAAMTNEQRHRMFLVLAQLVREKVQNADAKP